MSEKLFKARVLVIVMHKRGQFYLAAAIIIVIALFAISGGVNYFKKTQQEVKVYDLSSELQLESLKVIDYSIYNEKDVSLMIDNFTDNYFVQYSQEKEPGSEIVFVYGDSNNITIQPFVLSDSGSITYNVGGRAIVIENHRGQRKGITKFFKPSGNNVNVKINNTEYDFKLERGQNFFFIINKKSGVEQYVAKK